MATISPTTTAVTRAIQIPLVTNPCSDPAKIRAAKEADAITVKTDTTRPAIPVTARFEKADGCFGGSICGVDFNPTTFMVSTPKPQRHQNVTNAQQALAAEY